MRKPKRDKWRGCTHLPNTPEAKAYAEQYGFAPVAPTLDLGDGAMLLRLHPDSVALRLAAKHIARLEGE